MPVLKITNNGASGFVLADPETGFSENVPGNATTSYNVSDETLDNLEDELDDMASRTDANGDPLFVIDVEDINEGGKEWKGVGGVVHFLGNRLTVDSIVTNPTTPSTVSARRVDINAGEALVDGKLFTYAAAADFAGDAEIDKDGTDVSAVDLGTDEDVWMHVLAVNNADTREVIFVRGDAVDNTGSDSAEALTNDELAAAVQAHLGAAEAEYAFVEMARVLFEESTGLTQTTNFIDPAPPAYS